MRVGKYICTCACVSACLCEYNERTIWERASPWPLPGPAQLSSVQLASARLGSALSKVKRTDSDSVLPTCVTLQSGRHKDLRA